MPTAIKTKIQKTTISIANPFFSQLADFFSALAKSL